MKYDEFLEFIARAAHLAQFTGTGGWTTPPAEEEEPQHSSHSDDFEEEKKDEMNLPSMT